MPTLDEVRERLTEHPIDIPDPLDADTARRLMLETFEGCEREVIERYLTGPKDTSGIAIKRGDPIVVTDKDHKLAGQVTTVTRTVREGGNVTVLAKGKFQTTPEAMVRADGPDPARDLVSACAKAMRQDGPRKDPTAPPNDVLTSADMV